MADKCDTAVKTLKNNNPRHELTAEERMRGSKVKSFKKKYAAKLRQMKRKGMTGADLEWFEQVMSDPEASLFDIRKDIEQLRPQANVKEAVSLVNAKIATHKLAYGEKIKTENTHHIVNWTDILKNCEIKDDEEDV